MAITGQLPPSVTLKEVTTEIELYFANQFLKNYIYIDTLKSTGVTLSLFVNEKDYNSRLKVQEEILAKVFPSNSKLIEYGQPGGGSSGIGSVVVGEYPINGRYIRITLRPVPSANPTIRGKGNEDELVENIKQRIARFGPITIKFKPFKGVNEKIFRNVKDAEGVGTKGIKEFDPNTPEKFPKSDVNLILTDNTKVPISVKMENAEFWGSVEGWYNKPPGGSVGDKSAEWYLETAASTKEDRRDNNLIELVKGTNNNYYMTNPRSRNKDKKVSLIWKANKKMRTVAVFGSDILDGKGLIVKRTFRSADFIFEEKDNLLTIQTNQNIVDDNDLGDDVYVMCYYVSGRSGKSKYPGIACQVATKSRAIGSKGTNKILVERFSNRLQYKNWF